VYLGIIEISSTGIHMLNLHNDRAIFKTTDTQAGTYFLNHPIYTLSLILFVDFAIATPVYLITYLHY